jgi:TrmH family RNA methyltransferase
MATDRPSPDLTSPSNPRIKAVARLRDRRERQASGQTLVDGARELRRALEAGIAVIEAFVCEPLLAGEDARMALTALRDRRVPLTTVSPAVFAKIAFGDRTEGLVAVITTPPLALDAIRLPADALVVVIEDVEKPGNVGAILRSADGAGANAVIAASPRTDLGNPNVIRASAGTIFAVPLAAAPTAEVIAWLREREVRILAALVDGGRPYTDADLTGPVALVVGAEAEGLGGAWQGPGIEAVHVPMLGIADSLNVSVTAAVLLYEARRQRDVRSPGGRLTP